MLNVELKIGSTLYGGWQQIRIVRSLDRLAHMFELSLTERWTDDSEPLPILVDSECQVRIDGETVITGYIDDVITNYDKSSHSVTVAGRSRLAELVDCTGLGNSYNNRTLVQIAEDICKQFDIPVINQVGTLKPFTQEAIDDGESYFDFLDRLTRQRGTILTSTAEGHMVITRATSHDDVNTGLILGENILGASGRRTRRDRFHSYTFAGQHPGTGSYMSEGGQVNVTAKILDQAIRSTRVFQMIADDSATPHDAKTLLNWERNVRWGKSQTATYVVNGWHHKNGLWNPNTLVQVEDKMLRINGQRLITGVVFLLDSDGLRSEITVMPKEAYELKPELPTSTLEDESLL